jgi:hypothetical protein
VITPSLVNATELLKDAAVTRVTLVAKFRATLRQRGVTSSSVLLISAWTESTVPKAQLVAAMD